MLRITGLIFIFLAFICRAADDSPFGADISKIPVSLETPDLALEKEEDVKGEIKTSIPFNIIAGVYNSVTNVRHRELSFGELFPVEHDQAFVIQTTELNPVGTSGKFSISADGNQMITAIIKEDDLTLTSGGQELKIRDFRIGSGTGDQAAHMTGQLKDFNCTFFVGGTLVMQANQAPGFYRAGKTLVIQLD
ncbi:MAG: DUF4402 domain-containing protein [Candidatus Wallbacteria bacterium]|nr:DUF4402 domain-containing protein [Candidatus Wallbacteria bacterium]